MTPQPLKAAGTAPVSWPARLVKVLAAAIGLHSCLLGLLMLAAPGFMLSRIGFSGSQPLFFPSQSGVFLLIMGTFYLMATRWKAFELTILVSKSCAVVFLTVHVAFLAAPPLIWVADIEDALMLAAFAAALLWRKSKLGTGPSPEE